MFRFISAFVLALVPGMALADPGGCDTAGPGAQFCAGEVFERVDNSATPGQSYWLHADGYLSRVLVQQVAAERALQSRIESQIIAMISQQAEVTGYGFEFADLTSSDVAGAPFGTLSYVMTASKGAQQILHSYVAVDGVVVQVISQVARTSADPAALPQAHASALRAIDLVSTDPAI